MAANDDIAPDGASITNYKSKWHNIWIQDMLCSLHRGQSLHLDLDRAPYVLYGVKYIDLVSLCCQNCISSYIYVLLPAPRVLANKSRIQHKEA